MLDLLYIYSIGGGILLPILELFVYLSF